MRLISGLYHFDGKVVISGSIVELYHYEKGVFKGYVYSGGRSGVNGSSDKEKNRIDVLRRARKHLMRIVNANYGQWGDDVTCKFVTLTFRDNVRDLKSANYEFRKFIKRLNYEVFGRKCNELKYTVVPEFQERGAVHYHVIFYNLPYIDNEVLSRVWGHGFVKINKIDDIDNVGAYVCKYLTKAVEDDRLKGNKCYFNSRGLKKPKEVYLDEDRLRVLMEALPNSNKVYEAVYDNEYVGRVYYVQYNLGRFSDDICYD